MNRVAAEAGTNLKIRDLTRRAGIRTTSVAILDLTILVVALTARLDQIDLEAGHF
jgi:hypothetical protein